MSDAVSSFLSQKTVEGLSPTTIATYTKQLCQLVQALARHGVRLVAEVTAEDITAHMMELDERGLAHSTRLGHAATIHECFRVLHAHGRVLRNPAVDLPVGNYEDVPLPEAPLEPAEVAALIDAIPRRDAIDLRNRAHIEVLYGCVSDDN
jgi:site-specific recombinase XerD